MVSDEFQDFRGITFVIFFSTGLRWRIDSFFLQRVRILIWYAYKKYFCVFFFQCTCSVLSIWVVLRVSAQNKQKSWKSMKIMKKQAFWWFCQAASSITFVIFFSANQNIRIDSIFWIYVFLINWYAYKKNCQVKMRGSAFFMVLLALSWVPK